jgi:hypothetical protein
MPWREVLGEIGDHHGRTPTTPALRTGLATRSRHAVGRSESGVDAG